MTPPRLSPKREAEIRERVAAAIAGPWSMPPGEKLAVVTNDHLVGLARLLCSDFPLLLNELDAVRAEQEMARSRADLWDSSFDAAADRMNEIVADEGNQVKAKQAAALKHVFWTLGLLLASLGMSKEAIEQMSSEAMGAQNGPQAAFTKALLDLLDSGALAAEAQREGGV